MTAPDPRPVPVQPITPAALEAAFARISGTGPGVAERSFIAQAHEDYAADETPELSGDDLATVKIDAGCSPILALLADELVSRCLP